MKLLENPPRNNTTKVTAYLIDRLSLFSKLSSFRCQLNGSGNTEQKNIGPGSKNLPDKGYNQNPVVLPLEKYNSGINYGCPHKMFY